MFEYSRGLRNCGTGRRTAAQMSAEDCAVGLFQCLPDGGKTCTGYVCFPGVGARFVSSGLEQRQGSLCATNVDQCMVDDCLLPWKERPVGSRVVSSWGLLAWQPLKGAVVQRALSSWDLDWSAEKAASPGMETECCKVGPAGTRTGMPRRWGVNSDAVTHLKPA